MPGAIWLALIPYAASSCGVATYTVPVKLDGLFCGVPAWDSVTGDSSGTDRVCRLAARLLTCPPRRAAWVLLRCVIRPPPWLCCV